MIITLNKPNKSISIHKENCKIVTEKIGDINLSEHINGYKTTVNQIWFSEENFSLDKARKFFGDTDYCKVFCQRCFKRNK
jgi:predicted molibdopterin-dependent oxidoreductase YjgC